MSRAQFAVLRMDDDLKTSELVAAVNGLIKIYEKLSFANKDNFNIFSILRSPDDEVMLHSKFIYELLNPKGTHNMKDTYLLAFIEVIKEFVDLPYIDVEILTNSSVFRERRNIDLLILLPNEYTIVIENKIYASDQDRQLERYYNTVVNEFKRKKDKIIIIYLTLDGREPSDESVGNLEQPVYCVSYANEILFWLDKCLNISINYKTLYEVINQYKTLIINLTNSTEKESILMNETVALILSNKESFLSANTIKNAMPFAQAKIIEDLFFAFETEITELTKIKAISHTDCIKNYYTKKSIEECPIQLYPLKSYSKGDFKIDFCFFIEIYYTFYYGFIFAEKSEDGSCECIHKDSVKEKMPMIYSRCEKSIVDMCNYGINKSLPEDSSLYWNYFNDRTSSPYNFKQFSSNCIDLYMDLRQEVKRMCIEVLPMIQGVKTKI